MTPQVGDILQARLSWTDSVGGIMENVYTLRLTSFTGVDFDEVATDVTNWLVDLYTPWMNSVSDTIQSRDFTLSLRDVPTSEWNEVHTSSFLALQGQSGAESTPPINCGTVVAYPSQKRHRGFKNLPPPSEDAVIDGSLSATAVADLALFLIDYVLPVVGLVGGYDIGVLTLATNTFREFVGDGAVTSIVGSRTTRKQGRGI